MIISFRDLYPFKEFTSSFYFIGFNTENLLSLEKKGISVSFLAKERMTILNEIRDDIINFDKGIADVSDPLWLASDLAENNICLENFNLYILNTLSIIRNERLQKKGVVFICDDDEQVYLYKSLLKGNGLKITGRVNYFKLLRRLMGCLTQKVLGLYQSVCKVVILRSLRRGYRVKLQTEDLEKTDILCMNWVAEQSFRDGNLFLKDRYFGDLLSKLKQKKLKVAVMGKALDFVCSFKEIARSAINEKSQVYFLQDFLKISDIFKIFFQSFGFLKYFNHPFVVKDVNFSHLWQWFCLKDALKPRIPSALETFHAARSICKTIKNPDIKLIYPYENQAWEKVLALAFAQKFSSNHLYAYQHFPVSKDYLTIYPSNAYRERKINPKILLSDSFFGNYLREKGCGDTTLLGNFRFENVLKNDQQCSSVKKEDILCACSIQFNDSLELISRSIKLIQKFDPTFQQKITLTVNFHPLMRDIEKKKIRELFSDARINIHWSPLSADELLKSTRIVFYNSNSICLNAAANGIPAVFISSDLQIDLDRIPDISIKDDELGIKKIESILSNEDHYRMESNLFRGYFESYFVPPQHSILNEIFKRGQ